MPMRAGNERRQQRRAPAEIAVQDIGEIGAEREKRAVREIDDAEHAENDRQADRDQYVEKAENEAVDRLRQDHIEHQAHPLRIGRPARNGNWQGENSAAENPAADLVSLTLEDQIESILQALSASDPKAFAMSSGVLGNSALTSK